MLIDYPVLLLKRLWFRYLLQDVIQLVLGLILQLALDLHLGHIRRKFLELVFEDLRFIQEASLGPKPEELSKFELFLQKHLLIEIFILLILEFLHEIVEEVDQLLLVRDGSRFSLIYAGLNPIEYRLILMIGCFSRYERQRLREVGIALRVLVLRTVQVLFCSMNLFKWSTISWLNHLWYFACRWCAILIFRRYFQMGMELGFYLILALQVSLAKILGDY